MKRELSTGMDSFKKQKVLNEEDSVAQLILNILLMKPGSLPTQPHIGLNIRQYLNKLDNEADLSNLKEVLYSQCKELIPYLVGTDIVVGSTRINDRDCLVIMIPIDFGTTTSKEKNIYYIFSNMEQGLDFKYEIENLFD